MYVVKKPIHLKGRRRTIGEIVPASDVAPGREEPLVRAGYLTRIDSGLLDASEGVLVSEAGGGFSGKPELISIPILRKEGAMACAMEPSSILEGLRLLQTEAKEAVKAIGVIEDEDLLILLHACDSRKAVKEAAKHRAEALHEIGRAHV